MENFVQSHQKSIFEKLRVISRKSEFGWGMGTVGQKPRKVEIPPDRLVLLFIIIISTLRRK
jgi:hypothetical protein